MRIDLGPDKAVARQAATVLGATLPQRDSGVVVV
jgi:hypothetical protein